MAEVFTNDMVAHVYAQHEQQYGRNGNSSFYFDGPTLFSYGRHFPICTRIQSPAGVYYYAFTTDTYSTTTQRHISLARSAIRGRVIETAHVMALADATRGGAWPKRIADDLCSRFNDALAKAGRARKYAGHHLDDAREIADSAKWLAAHYQWPNLDLDLPATDAEAADQAKAAAEAARQAIEQRRERERAEKAVQFNDWRAGQPVSFPNSYAPADGSALLTYRPATDEIISSQGARFPADHARRAWPILQRARKAGQTRPIPPIRLGHFTIDALTTGGVKAGCHFVKWAEVESVMAKLPAPVSA